MEALIAMEVNRKDFVGSGSPERWVPTRQAFGKTYRYFRETGNLSYANLE